MKETLYLIGGSGFIGKNLVRLLSHSYSITVFDKYIDTSFFSRYPDIQTVILDLAKDKISKNYQTPNYIINLASIVSVERDLSLFNELISSNLKVLLNLFERFKDDVTLKLFIQFGSSEEYGNIHSPFREDMRECPNSPYALIKQLTTNTALMLYRNYKFPTIVVRPGNLFGPGQNESKFIPYIVNQLIENKKINVSPCEQRRDFLYIEDFVTYIHIILKNYKEILGEIINVSSGRSISLREVINFYKEYLKSSSEINYGAIPYRENEVMDLRCDVSKLSSITFYSEGENSLKKYADFIIKRSK